MHEIVDDKSQYCIPFILERIKIHASQYVGDANAPPFFLGLNGVQGAGKTVLVSQKPTVTRECPEVRFWQRLMRQVGFDHQEHLGKGVWTTHGGVFNGRPLPKP